MAIGTLGFFLSWRDILKGKSRKWMAVNARNQRRRSSDVLRSDLLDFFLIDISPVAYSKDKDIIS